MKPYRSLAILVLLAIPCVNRAEQLEFRVAMEDLPGIDEVQSGQVDLGISILEARKAAPGSVTWQRTIATLCGVYVLAAEYKKATKACETAIANAPGETAFNNRGVLRVHNGDLDGAFEDFEKARPKDVGEYLQLIRESDPKLIAVSNTKSLEYLRLRLDTAHMREPQKLSSAAVENVLN
jgi:hypothetical protein